MPELPEVEVTCRNLQPQLEGRKLVALWMGKPLRWPLGVDTHQLAGRVIERVQRRGKYLVLQLDHGVLLVHLGMSGSLRWETTCRLEGARPRQVHDHAAWVFSDGELVFNDPRRFGAVVYAPSLTEGMAQRLLQRLGIEPLSSGFNPASLGRELSRHRAAIKQVLLAGTVVVGVGNIYASEALFRAGIHPYQPAHRVGNMAIQRLCQAIVEVLSHAIELGGSTLRNFHAPSGAAGAFQSIAQVYGRSGEPCVVCGGQIVRMVQGQRSTFYCPTCQPLV